MTLFRCDRCGNAVSPDAPRYLAVLEIAHVADPPVWKEEDRNRDFETEIRELLKTMEGWDPQDLEEQVYVRRCLRLCATCRRRVLEAMTPGATLPLLGAEQRRSPGNVGDEEE